MGRKKGDPDMLGNTKAVTHGIYSAENRAPNAMTAFDVDSLHELREMVKTAAGRDDLKLEIIARLTLIARKFFSDAFQANKHPGWWNTGIVGRGATYLAELRRWLDAMPKVDPEVIDAEVLKVYREDTDAQNS